MLIDFKLNLINRNSIKTKLSPTLSDSMSVRSYSREAHGRLVTTGLKTSS